MKPIPMKTVWDVTGREPDAKAGYVKCFERFASHREAVARRNELQEEDSDLIYEVTESESIVPDLTMPDPSQIKELCNLMFYGIVTLRNLGLGGKSEAVAELADTLHNLPQEMFKEGVWDWNLLEYGLRDFEGKFPEDKIFPMAAMLRRIRDGGSLVE
mgnify:CR=1 FL=1